jgi:hypothetical protein
MSRADSPPDGYTSPSVAWCAEYVDPRQPQEGSFQMGAFTTEIEAEKLLRRLEADGFFAELRINPIPVYQRIEDWEWER